MRRVIPVPVHPSTPQHPDLILGLARRSTEANLARREKGEKEPSGQNLLTFQKPILHPNLEITIIAIQPAPLGIGLFIHCEECLPFSPIQTVWATTKLFLSWHDPAIDNRVQRRKLSSVFWHLDTARGGFHEEGIAVVRSRRGPCSYSKSGYCATAREFLGGDTGTK